MSEEFGTEEFGKEYWEERYRSGHMGEHHGWVNPHLVAEAGDLAPGTALDAGCGEGASALWLAAHGWQVTGVDISATALARAREQAAAAGVTDRVEWVEADLTDWLPPAEHFDLVTTHYVHAAGLREEFFRSLAAAVAPGGTLLVVGHQPAEADDDPHAPAPGTHVTAEEIAAVLDPDRWDIVVAAARSRTAAGHDGNEITLHDAVLRARKQG